MARLIRLGKETSSPVFTNNDIDAGREVDFDIFKGGKLFKMNPGQHFFLVMRRNGLIDGKIWFIDSLKILGKAGNHV